MCSCWRDILFSKVYGLSVHPIILWPFCNINSQIQLLFLSIQSDLMLCMCLWWLSWFLSGRVIQVASVLLCSGPPCCRSSPCLSVSMGTHGKAGTSQNGATPPNVSHCKSECLRFLSYFFFSTVVKCGPILEPATRGRPRGFVFSSHVVDLYIQSLLSLCRRSLFVWNPGSQCQLC